MPDQKIATHQAEVTSAAALWAPHVEELSDLAVVIPLWELVSVHEEGAGGFSDLTGPWMSDEIVTNKGK